MNTCPNCGKMAGLHGSILQGCMCQYSMQTPPQRTEQEPVTLPCCGYRDASAIKWNALNDVVQCHNCGQTYTQPPQRTWVGLTDEESSLLLNQSDLLDMFENIGWYSAPKNGFKKNSATLIRAIEAKLKQKNGFAEEKNND